MEAENRLCVVVLQKMIPYKELKVALPIMSDSETPEEVVVPQEAPVQRNKRRRKRSENSGEYKKKLRNFAAKKELEHN